MTEREKADRWIRMRVRRESLPETWALSFAALVEMGPATKQDRMRARAARRWLAERGL